MDDFLTHLFTERKSLFAHILAEWSRIDDQGPQNISEHYYTPLENISGTLDWVKSEY